MKRDFTLTVYKEFLKTLIRSGYQCKTFLEVLLSPEEDFTVLRHDIDDKKEHALWFAQIQHAEGIRGTYYFRAVPESFDEKIISRISEMGHEIGYHYETMDTSGGNPDKAFEEFQENLERFRKIADIRTICMHGSPQSPFDNRDLWKKYNYRESGISGEPYLDLDFSSTAYYTDTGRMWDGHRFAIRDSIAATYLKYPVYHSTLQIIQAAEIKTFPKKSMLTFHPQRWTDHWRPWIKELLWQNTKNTVKYLKMNT